MKHKLSIIKNLVTIFTFVIVMNISMHVAAFTVNTDSVTLYSLDSNYEATLSIPDDSDHLKEFQIVVGDTEATPTYKVVYQSQANYDGNDYNYSAVKVSDTGLVTPGYTTWYWSGGFGSTAYNPNATKIQNDPNEGVAVVRVTIGNEYHDILFKNIDYAPTYAEERMEQYIKENINDGMTAKEIATEAAKFAASFDYDYHYSSAQSMIINGGGDCWASTDLIVKVCKKCGLKAWSRNGNRDSGAGSGHMNALVEAETGNLWYEVEAGYGMSKNSETGLRPYNVTERTSLFSYRTKSYKDNTIEVYQYDGNDTSLKTLVIPETIGDKTVVSIGDKFIQQNSYVEEVIMPDTITNIGSSAFNSCSKLVTLNIPASVETIGQFAFTNCNNLSQLTIDKDNANYTIIDGVIYDKDVTKLIAAPYVSEVTVPDSVTTIGEYSLYYNKNLTAVKMGENVKNILEGALGDCSLLETVDINDNVEVVGSNAFRNTSKLTELVLPESVTEIGDYALHSTGAEVYILTEEATIGKNVVNSQTVIHCVEGSTMATYASENESSNIISCSKEEMLELLDSFDEKDEPGTDPEVKEPEKEEPGTNPEVKEPEKEEPGTDPEVKEPEKEEPETNPEVKEPEKDEPGTNPEVKEPEKEEPGTNPEVKVPEKEVSQNEIVAEKRTFTVGKNGLTYEIVSADDKKDVALITFTNKKVKTLSIPATVTYNGIEYKVTVISDGALKNAKKLKSVTIGKNISKIGKDAFRNCKLLKDIRIKTTLLNKKSIGKNAIKGTSKKLVIKVPGKKKKEYKKAFKGKGNNKAKIR
ncbi:MAG: leucine-rich repeat protein [Lachnospiraceae bacterium]|nr:leucine-rich repeat protein [Lachnospiraceae bacterium]